MRLPIALTGLIAARTETNVSFRIGGRVRNGWSTSATMSTPGDSGAPRSAGAAIRCAFRAGRGRCGHANLTQTTAAFQRQDALLKQGFTTRRDYDQAQQAMQVAQGSLESAQSRSKNAKDALGYTELLAPRGPVLSRQRNVETGQVVQAAQTIYTIAEDGDRDAIFNVNEAALPTAAQSRHHDHPDQQSQHHGPRQAARDCRRSSTSLRNHSGQGRHTQHAAEMALGAAITGSVTRCSLCRSILLPWRAMFSDAG